MIEGVVNLRDVGGLATSDGRVVRRGLVHRSGHLGSLAVEPDDGDDDLTGDSGHAGARRAAPRAMNASAPPAAAFLDTGIRTVFDLRTSAEVTRSPDQVPDPVEVVHLDVLADATESIAAHLEEIFADPTSAARVFADGVVERHYEQTYRNLVLLESARTAYAQLFALLVEAEHPVLFHCTAGKDRTGWAAASLLRLLGVGDDDIVADYLRSNEPVLDGFRPFLQQFSEMGGDPKLLEPAFLVEPRYLEAAFETVEQEHGSIEGYFRDALGLSPDAQAALRERLLAPRR